MRGLIVKVKGAVFAVKTSKNTVTCVPSGKFRLSGTYPLAGDNVEIQAGADGTGVITEIYPRRNQLVRPAVANVNRLAIVASQADPVTSPELIDFLTVLALYKKIEPFVVFNKNDKRDCSEIAGLYRTVGFPVFSVSAVSGEGIEELRSFLSDGITVLTGNSGVGKSSVLNALFPGISARTGQISEKIGRGKQTTRHVELVPSGRGYVADTPGYSSFDAVEMEIVEKDMLAPCFPDFAVFLGACEYADCSHVNDDGCAVRAAKERGEIEKSRYESYVKLYTRIKDIKKWQMKK